MFRASLDTIMTAAGHTVAAKFPMASAGAPHTWLLIAAAACALLPLEISHLVSLLVGALGYLLVQTMQAGFELGGAQSGRASKTGAAGAPSVRPLAGPRGGRAPPPRAERCAGGGAVKQVPAGPRVEVRKPSAVPVAAPTFQAVGWDAEVAELLRRVAPTPEGDRAVAQIAGRVKRAISQVAPDAQVRGFAGGNLMSGTAFGVAVPEVDIVVSIKSEALFGRLQGRWSHGQNAGQRLDPRKLQKSAIRAITGELVGTEAFKFRRSAFRGQEPKVTLIAPPTAGTPEQGVPVNLLVNAQTPLRNAALLGKCSEVEPLTMQLQLLVKRWAKDRGLSHAAKGHLSPYAWTLLTIYFLQVGREGEQGAHLPPLAGLEVAPGLRVSGSAAEPAPAAASCEVASAGALFKDFVRFYAQCFDWRKEAVCVRSGRRAPPDLSVPLHIIVHEDGVGTEVGPSIEDPFEQSQNVGECMTAASLERLHKELQRAHELCTSDASLTQLLEPWAPPEVAAGQGEEDEEN